MMDTEVEKEKVQPAEKKVEADVVEEKKGRVVSTLIEHKESESEPEKVEELKHPDHDSMVTVRLSEPPTLTVDTHIAEATPRRPRAATRTSIASTKSTKSKSELEVEEDNNITPRKPVAGANEEELEEEEVEKVEESPRITMMDPNGNEFASPSGSESAGSRDPDSRRGSDSSETSGGEEVNWEELEKTEEQEPRDQGSDDSTALLLARLEQENNLLATNPKSGIAKVQIEEKRNRGGSRPPSIQYLKKLVNGPTPPALRYSLIPAPPMTDLEFYAALVQDYNRTAQCLPTLLSKKIRSGIPPPLRGVVWQSMSGARDQVLEEQFDRLCGESSPYEGIIGKDLGRSFPGVEMFRDPEGDGQRMLGRVLKCFSLYDHKIGYCQGLGFLVGPLLMHMGDKQAFCVLVRLMEHYDLRNCFLPDLSGLHVRIHQFRELLKQHLPTLSAHLAALQIEPQYVSQWFLSFFAVTCPLPMLFRIYDVIFAEGASETIMRVALSLMRKNEEKIMACTEFEDVMQLLLSRGLWDCYHYNADEFVEDFVSLTGVVTHESLKALEESFRETSKLDTVIPSENIGSAASRFLGRLWAGSNNNAKSLSPGLTAPSRPASFLRRSGSKQSLASTLNSMEGGGSEMSNSTDATSISRDSSNTDGSSIRAQSASFATVVNTSKPNKDKNLHGQIEDLLTALSELQRDHAILATQLQREREEREEDRHAVRSLLDGLRKKPSSETVNSPSSEGSLETVKPTSESQSSPTSPIDEDSEDSPAVSNEEALSQLLEVVEDRFAPVNNRRSSMLQSKSQLRDELARSKEQLINELSKCQDLNRQLLEHSQEIQNLRDQVREGHAHIRAAHSEKQRLEKQIHDLRARRSTATTPDETRENQSEWPSRGSSHGGLRELKLGRQNSNRSQTTFSKRTSSLNSAAINYKENESQNFVQPPPSPTKASPDVDALVLELVQAKTEIAVAKQEAEEAKAKLENFRKMLGAGSGDSPGAGSGPTNGHRPSPSLPPSMLERSVTTSFVARQPSPKVETPPAATGGGGFWAGWGKRTVSTADAKS